MIPRLKVRRVLADALYGQVLECDIHVHNDNNHDNHDHDHPDIPTRVAVKYVSLDLLADAKTKTNGIRSIDDPFQEARVAQNIMDAGGHPNVVQPILQLTQPDEMMLVSELCDGGDLYNYMSARREAEIDGGGCGEGSECGCDDEVNDDCKAEGVTDRNGSGGGGGDRHGGEGGDRDRDGSGDRNGNRHRGAGRIGEVEAARLMRQVVRGVHFLHDRVGVAHRDLSLENVLLSTTSASQPDRHNHHHHHDNQRNQHQQYNLHDLHGLDNHDDHHHHQDNHHNHHNLHNHPIHHFRADDITLKISDFGLAVSANSVCHDVAGKDIYMAPEVVDVDDLKAYDPIKADIWSLGIMWFILLTGSQLFCRASKSDPTLVYIEQHGVGAVFGAWGYGDLAKSSTAALLSQMLRADPAERIDVVSILLHPVLEL